MHGWQRALSRVLWRECQLRVCPASERDHTVPVESVVHGGRVLRVICRGLSPRSHVGQHSDERLCAKPPASEPTPEPAAASKPASVSAAAAADRGVCSVHSQCIVRHRVLRKHVHAHRTVCVHFFCP